VARIGNGLFSTAVSGESLAMTETAGYSASTDWNSKPCFEPGLNVLTTQPRISWMFSDLCYFLFQYRLNNFLIVTGPPGGQGGGVRFSINKPNNQAQNNNNFPQSNFSQQQQNKFYQGKQNKKRQQVQQTTKQENQQNKSEQNVTEATQKNNQEQTTKSPEQVANGADKNTSHPAAGEWPPSLK
jgi:hypothetical protein